MRQEFMGKEEFVHLCVESGYSNKKVAEMYAKGKEKFTNDDFIEVYRMVERALDIARDTGKFQVHNGNRTTKRYKQSERMGSDRAESKED